MQKYFFRNVFSFIVIFLCLNCFNAGAVAIGAGELCYDNETIIELPVYANALNHIKGVNGILNYSPSVFTFVAYDNLQPWLDNVSIVGNSITGQIFIDIKNNMTFSLGDDTLFILKFLVTAPIVQSMPFEWDTAYYLSSGSVFLNLPFIDGVLAIPALINSQPLDVSACAFDTIHMIASSSGNSIFQWQESVDGGTTWAMIHDDYKYSGADSEIMQIITRGQMNNNLYRCQMGYPVCGIYSDEALLEVVPNILSHPSDTVINPGGTAVFHAQANGAGATYLWEVSSDGGLNWSSTALFPPVTTPSLTIVNPPLFWHTYKFRCIIQGVCSPPTDTTETASLYIGSAAGLSNSSEGKLCLLFPNPIKEYFVVETPNDTEFDLYIYDVFGRELCHFSHLSSNQLIYKPSISSGLYMYRLNLLNNNTEQWGRLIIE
ncbi:MAG: T9SS type A sorting domain-containing protein [Bacteroidales bacterium]|nr:T9SS type A sorting domain-containing protein [Bacteroidales bacterium]